MISSHLAKFHLVMDLGVHMVDVIVDHGQRDEDRENSDQREGHSRIGDEPIGLLSSIGLEHVALFFLLPNQNLKKSLHDQSWPVLTAFTDAGGPFIRRSRREENFGPVSAVLRRSASFFFAREPADHNGERVLVSMRRRNRYTRTDQTQSPAVGRYFPSLAKKEKAARNGGDR